MILPSDYVDVINVLHVVIALRSFCGYLTFTHLFFLTASLISHVSLCLT